MSLARYTATGALKLRCDRAECPRVFVSPNRRVEQVEVSRIFDEASEAGWRCSPDVGGPDFCPGHKAVRS
jgi:hypothetical protein